MPVTRPRMKLNSYGICNACEWNEVKQNLNWEKRWNTLEKLCDKYRSNKNSDYNVIVPYSGGKNGAYIAYTLREKLGMNPLCVTIRPPIEEKIGIRNIQNFIDRGFAHIMITPNRISEKIIDKDQFVNKGIPMHAFMISVQTAIMRASVNFNVPFVMFAEEGESEYGGTRDLLDEYKYDINHSINLYLSGTDPNNLVNSLKLRDSYWHTYPNLRDLEKVGTELCHWSYFENFVNYKHYLIAKEFLGLEEREERNIGAIENFSATDTNLIHLYFYLMYIKFGFGRTTSEVGNEIRRKSMSRDQAINIVNSFDGEFPEKHIEEYLDYYNMSESEFFSVLEKWTNKDLFLVNNGRVTKNFYVE